MLAPLSSALKKMLNGLAYADAGEYLTMTQKSEYLNKVTQTVENPPVSTTVKSNKPTETRARRRIALYLGSELPSTMMDYVIDTCSSLDHDLTVLTFESGRVTSALLEQYNQRLEDNEINMEVARLSGEPIKGLARYLRNHPEIAFMACKDSGYLGRSYMNGAQLKSALPVPVVVVVVNPQAADAQTAKQSEQVGKAGTA